MVVPLVVWTDRWLLSHWASSHSYWCVLRMEWMGCWRLLGLLIVSQRIIPENSLRLAQVSMSMKRNHATVAIENYSAILRSFSISSPSFLSWLDVSQQFIHPDWMSNPNWWVKYREEPSFSYWNTIPPTNTSTLNGWQLVMTTNIFKEKTTMGKSGKYHISPMKGPFKTRWTRSLPTLDETRPRVLWALHRTFVGAGATQAQISPISPTEMDISIVLYNGHIWNL